jgi:hypothetical protein
MSMHPPPIMLMYVGTYVVGFLAAKDFPRRTFRPHEHRLVRALVRHAGKVWKPLLHVLGWLLLSRFSCMGRKRPRVPSRGG